jgi:hypothetical protein
MLSRLVQRQRLFHRSELLADAPAPFPAVGAFLRAIATVVGVVLKMPVEQVKEMLNKLNQS